MGIGEGEAATNGGADVKKMVENCVYRARIFAFDGGMFGPIIVHEGTQAPSNATVRAKLKHAVKLAKVGSPKKTGK